MKNEFRTLSSSVRQAADKLRAEALDRTDGELIGSEDELLEMLGVSRPTFRQAAKIIEHEHLLRIRRGKRGGFFARKPSTQAVSHLAGIFLKSRETTQRHLQLASDPILAQAAVLAAQCHDPNKLALLNSFVTEEATLGDSLELHVFLANEKQFLELLYGLAGNPVLDLYGRVIFDYSMSFAKTGVFSGHRDRAIAYAGARNALAQAIMAGDPDLSRVYAERCNALVAEWMRDDQVDETHSAPIVPSNTTSATGATPTSVQTAAHALREEILLRDDGEHLGSEDDLLKMLNVSRPTFRQAAKIIEHEQLLKIRRGKSGGFYAQKPAARAVSRLAGVYLKVNGTQQRDLHFASAATLIQAVKLASRSLNKEHAEKLRRFIELGNNDEQEEQPTSIMSFLTRQGQFFDLVYLLAENPVLELFNAVNIAYSKSFLPSGIFSKHLNRATAYTKERNSLAQAILVHDEKVAEILARRCCDFVYNWLLEDESTALAIN